MAGLSRFWREAPPQARPFDHHDWQAFSGAVQWADGQPVLREIGEYLVIASAEGTEVVKDGEPMVGGFAFPSQRAALSWLNLLPQDFVPADYGFES